MLRSTMDAIRVYKRGSSGRESNNGFIADIIFVYTCQLVFISYTHHLLPEQEINNVNNALVWDGDLKHDINLGKQHKSCRLDL